MNEPTSPETVAAWIDTAQHQRDPFEPLRRASHDHREQHGPGCSVYPTSSGPLLAVLAATIRAERILEGCAHSPNKRPPTVLVSVPVAFVLPPRREAAQRERSDGERRRHSSLVADRRLFWISGGYD
jgi:hypothetical protein